MYTSLYIYIYMYVGAVGSPDDVIGNSNDSKTDHLLMNND